MLIDDLRNNIKISLKEKIKTRNSINYSVYKNILDKAQKDAKENKCDVIADEYIIRAARKELKQNEVYKLFNVIWNNDLGESEITVENDAGFRAIIIGNTSGIKKSRGYMYLFYTNNDTESFPTIKEIEHRLRVVANQEILTDKNANYFDWEQYGSLEEQRKYFSEIILNTTK